MIRVEVELSAESMPLAWAEVEGAAAAVGGRVLTPCDPPPTDRLVEVELRDRASARELAQRLAFARRLIEFRGPALPPATAGWTEQARSGASASVRWIGHARRGGTDPAIDAVARAWSGSGGRIDLDHPDRRFWLRPRPGSPPELGEEIGAVDRSLLFARRMSRLPFRRPVSLDPRLARAAVNLARVRPRDRVIDPFAGTGALLAEAALLGARVVGVDMDVTMVRGAARNFQHVGVAAEAWIVGDAEEAVTNPLAQGSFDALVTDVPYGRSSGTQGEAVDRLLHRVLPVWADRIRPEGFAVVVSAGPTEPLGRPWVQRRAVAVRQHRSLTRTFSVYQRQGATD